MTSEPTEFRQVFQLGIVVRDVDASVEKYRELLNVPEQSIHRFETKDLPSWMETRYRGRPSNFHLKIALLDFGGMQFELIEPVAGEPSIYSEFLESVGQGIQHIMVLPRDHDDMVRRLDASGAEIVNQGQMHGGEFRYYDLTDELGFVLELFGGIPEEYVRGLVGTGIGS
jgi:catechol 2,3-dioxygenase-like lactoylglutathione lyase family enzyme